MPWHTDNNRQTGNSLTSKHHMPGLLFMFYLSDVTKNSFQLVRGSHRWPPSDEIYLSDKYIDKNYAREIITVKMCKGSFIACDINVAHRAKPFKDCNHERTTLLFQVDQVGTHQENAGHGEPILINTAFCENPTQDLLQYLGFGFRTDYPAFPDTSPATMSTKDLVQLQRQLVPLASRALIKNLVKGIVPAQTITLIKRLRWSLAQRQ
jgi:hypothetical protein